MHDRRVVSGDGQMPSAENATNPEQWDDLNLPQLLLLLWPKNLWSVYLNKILLNHLSVSRLLHVMCFESWLLKLRNLAEPPETNQRLANGVQQEGQETFLDYNLHF